MPAGADYPGQHPSELAEPAIGEIHLHYTADQPLRTDRKDIFHDQHPDRQFRIDRRTTHRRIMGCKFAAEPGQIESSVDLPHQMIFGDRIAKTKLRTVDLGHPSDGPSWIDLTENRLTTTESRLAACLNSPNPASGFILFIRSSFFRFTHLRDLTGIPDLADQALVIILRLNPEP
jgi:hypothetical protein